MIFATEPAKKKSVKTVKRSAMISKRSTKTERNSGKTRHDWTRLTASSKQTCARDSSADSIRLTAQVSGGRALPFTVPARRESPLTTLTVKVTIQGL